MKIVKLETFLTNSGLRNYLFVRLTTDSGLTGVGEGSLEWQEKTVETLIHEWVEDRILGVNPFDVESIVADLIRDQYQGGSTVLTAISGVEVAMWDIIGKANGQPVYELLGGRVHDRLAAYANGWYGGARTPEDYAERAKEVIKRGYSALKFDPFGVAWQELSREQMNGAEAIVAAIQHAVGDDVKLLIEAHGRFALDSALEMGRRLEKYNIGFYEEPVSPYRFEDLKQVKSSLPLTIAAGERIYTREDFERFCLLRAADILQPDLCHIGGLSIGRQIAVMAADNGLKMSPHVSVGPIALCAALHFDWATPNFLAQENFSEYDVPWRSDLVCGWNPIRDGFFELPETPGLGIDIDPAACAKHPYRKNTFPSLWDKQWLTDFTQKDRSH